MLRILGGKHKNRGLYAPKKDSTRPTASQLREALFNICQQKVLGASFLDLFAGSGAMGCEAVSRGAARVVFVEKDREALRAIRKNVALLEEEGSSHIMGKEVMSALSFLHEKGEHFDIIYLDPPYGKGWSNQVLTFLDTHPLLAEEGVIFVEDSTSIEEDFETLKIHSSRRKGRAYLTELIQRAV
ncbi:MAG: Ribosomal RNA small subunit methyltransferase D [Chlamydiae bacterium]|nr:Ribosomal RNA small subunit methyltransferase D [Chlamydiota bacterium]